MFLKKNVYLFGECYFETMDVILSELDTNEEFQFSNMSISGGACYDFNTFLKSQRFLEQGIFVLGGSVHDQWSFKSQFLPQILNWFETSLYDSVLIFALTGQRDGADNKLHHFYNNEKLKLINGKNILSFDMRFEASKSHDGLHIHKEEKHDIASKLIDFLKTIKFHIQEVKINNLVKDIPIEKCKKIIIIHRHNNATFEVKDGGKFSRRYVYYKHLNKDTKGHWSHLDRLLITEISDPKPGLISFSQEIYVDKVIIEF